MADRRSKRAAPQGQWRTPPTPFFGTDAGTDALAELDTTGATAPSWSMPHPAGVGLPTAGEGDAEMGGTTSGGDDSGAMPPDGGMDTAVGVAAVGAAAVDSKDRKLEETVAAMAISDVRARGPAAFGSMYARASGAPPAAPRTHVAAPSPGSADDPGDIANMVRRMQQEEERRARRRARNRISARARRQKKKDLAGLLEARVKVLEDAINAVKRHMWGREGLGRERFLEALDFEVLPPEIPSSTEVQHRGAHLADLIVLGVEHLRANLIENEAIVLAALAAGGDGMPRPRSMEKLASAATGPAGAASPRPTSVLTELVDYVGLTADQVRAVRELSVKVAAERREMAHLDKCVATLVANRGESAEELEAHRWLYFQAVDVASGPWRTVLSNDQVERLVRWTRANAAAIEALPFPEFTSVAAAVRKDAPAAAAAAGPRAGDAGTAAVEDGWFDAGSELVRSAVKAAEALKLTLAALPDSTKRLVTSMFIDQLGADSR